MVIVKWPTEGLVEAFRRLSYFQLPCVNFLSQGQEHDLDLSLEHIVDWVRNRNMIDDSLTREKYIDGANKVAKMMDDG